MKIHRPHSTVRYETKPRRQTNLPRCRLERHRPCFRQSSRQDHLDAEFRLTRGASSLSILVEGEVWDMVEENRVASWIAWMGFSCILLQRLRRKALSTWNVPGQDDVGLLGDVTITQKQSAHMRISQAAQILSVPSYTARRPGFHINQNKPMATKLQRRS